MSTKVDEDIFFIMFCLTRLVKHFYSNSESQQREAAESRREPPAAAAENILLHNHSATNKCLGGQLSDARVLQIDEKL